MDKLFPSLCNGTKGLALGPLFLVKGRMQGASTITNPDECCEKFIFRANGAGACSHVVFMHFSVGIAQ